MSIKLNTTGSDQNSGAQQGGSYVKQTEEKQGRKLFANKNANRALIIAGVVIGVVLVGCLVLLAIPLG